MTQRDAFISRWCTCVERSNETFADFVNSVDSLLVEHAKEIPAETATPEEPKYLTREEWSLLKVGSVVKYHFSDHPIQFKVIEPISMSGHIQGDDGRGRWVWQEDGFTLVSTPEPEPPQVTVGFLFLTESEWDALPVGALVIDPAQSVVELREWDLAGWRRTSVLGSNVRWHENTWRHVGYASTAPATHSEIEQAFKFLAAEIEGMNQTGLYSEWATANAATRLSEAIFWVDQMKQGKKEDAS